MEGSNAVPGEGIHAYRVCDIAVVDVAGTIVGAYVIAKLFKIPFGLVLLCLFMIGIIVHRALKIRTTVDKMLFDE
jgi:hypothetical protein